MWLNNIIVESKALSPVEFLVLTRHSDDQFLKSTDLLNDLSSLFTHWNADKGTVYPILHRLERRGLLERGTGRMMSFRRSRKGKSVLSSSSETVASQVEVMVEYFLAVTEELVSADPIAAKSLIKSFQLLVEMMHSKLEELDRKADKVISEDDWHEIPVG